jgi:hypothetical protein
VFEKINKKAVYFCSVLFYSVTRFFASGFFMNHFPQAPENNIRVIFFKFCRKFADASQSAPSVPTPAVNLSPLPLVADLPPAANYGNNIRLPSF